MAAPGKSIVILTGAGISAESGIPTFRSGDGLWCNHPVEEVATPEGYARNPALVQQFYNARRSQLREVIPNSAHNALARLAEEWQGELLLVTQNVDDLHDRAHVGRKPGKGYRLLPMHGELKKARCTQSSRVFSWEDDITLATLCPCCKEEGLLRPHIVWFNEMPLEMESIYRAVMQCDLFISIGTSGNVYPAAGLVSQARIHGRAYAAELNMEPSQGESLFHEKIYGPATQIVPPYVERILAGEII